jgi:hypothetical protein
MRPPDRGVTEKTEARDHGHGFEDPVIEPLLEHDGRSCVPRTVSAQFLAAIDGEGVI